MREEEARRLLEVGADAGPGAVRAAYRKLLLRTHPDVSGQRDATERTVRLTEAYRLLVGDRAGRAPDDDGPTGADSWSSPSAQSAGGSGGTAAHSSGSSDPVVATEQAAPGASRELRVALVDQDTIAVAANPEDTMLLLLDVANRLGDVVYHDRSAGLIEAVVEFVDAPTSSVLLDVQGRTDGGTAVYCTVEPLSGGVAPTAPAVTRLLLDTLVHPPTPPHDR